MSPTRLVLVVSDNYGMIKKRALVFTLMIFNVRKRKIIKSKKLNVSLKF